MRRVFAAILAALLIASAAAASTGDKPNAPLPPGALSSLETIQRWMNAYRSRRDLVHVPEAVQAMGQLGAFRDPDAAGVYVGFMAGILGSNPAEADRLVGAMLTLPPADHWAVVRAIAWSGLPDWKQLLIRHAARIPTRKLMVDKFLAGQLPTLDKVGFPPKPGIVATMREAVDVTKYFSDKKPVARADILEPNSALLDAYWGYYFATGAYAPAVSRIVAMLPLAKEREDADRLTLGMMAKYTLATNASRDAKLMEMLKRTRPHHPEKVAAALGEAIEAAETVETAKLRKEALAAIEDLKRKGPQSRRDMTMWGKIGEGAIGLGCIAAAALGQVEFGLPCVVGGAVTSAALRAWGSTP